MQVLRRFRADRSGATAVIFGLALLPIAGFAGAALDYSRATSNRSALQKAADSTALTMVAAAAKGQSPDYKTVFAQALAGHGEVRALDVQGEWIVAGRQFRVGAKGNVATSVFQVFQPKVDIAVAATAESSQAVTEIEIDGVSLSPEAADYNELSVYCYNGTTGERLGPLDPKNPEKRLPFQKIADNTDEGVAKAPTSLTVQCRSGEEASYHLKNVRWARTSPALRATGETWNHYTDTTKVKGNPKAAPIYNTLYKNLIETVVCDTRAECTSEKGKGGKVPRGKERAPEVAADACKTGGYIYFGWEDRPPNIKDPKTGQTAWTDRDYDDIRFVTRCPESKAGPLNIRLIS